MTSDVTRIAPADYAKPTEAKLVQHLTHASDKEFNVEVQLCPVLVCFDGLEMDDEFVVERFHGCGHGKGAQVWYECGEPVTFGLSYPVHVFTLPGRYRVRRADDQAIDLDAVAIDVSDLSFEFAGLWVANQARSKPSV